MNNQTKNTRELSFTDLVQFVMGRTGLGYAKSAEIVDRLIEPQLTQTKQETIQSCISALPEKVEWTIGEARQFSTDLSQSHMFQYGHNQAIDQAHTALNKIKEQNQ